MDWKDDLSEETRKYLEPKNLESVEALAKMYQNLESLQGSSLRIPSAEASTEDMSKFYEKVQTRVPQLMLRPDPDSPEQMTEYYRMQGVPESIDDYDAGEVKLSADIVNELKTLAKTTKMTKAQFKSYVKSMEDMNGVTQQSIEDARVRMGAELKTEWGMAFEDRYAVVERHLQENPDLGSIENLTPSQVRGHYAVAQSLNGMAQAHSQPVVQRGRLAPDEAKAQLSEVTSKLFDSKLNLAQTNPDEYRRLKDKRIELMKAATPERYS